MSQPSATRKFLAACPVELAAFALVFAADSAGHVPVSKTPFLFLIATCSLWLRGTGWVAAGLKWTHEARLFIGAGLVAGVAFWAFEYFVENPILFQLTGRMPDLSTFAAVTGNLEFLAIFLALNLVLAGFGEEMVWRGYALPRTAEVFGDDWFSWTLAFVAVNTAFGLAHFYQGEAGVIQASVQGVLLGCLYLLTGRNLIAPIAAHFTANTCDFILIYLGVHVGLGGQ
jgi:membrane protease YdiL (CAAX protease family)